MSLYPPKFSSPPTKTLFIPNDGKALTAYNAFVVGERGDLRRVVPIGPGVERNARSWPRYGRQSEGPSPSCDWNGLSRDRLSVRVHRLETTRVPRQHGASMIGRVAGPGDSQGPRRSHLGRTFGGVADRGRRMNHHRDQNRNGGDSRQEFHDRETVTSPSSPTKNANGRLPWSDSGHQVIHQRGESQEVETISDLQIAIGRRRITDDKYVVCLQPVRSRACRVSLIRQSVV